MGVQTTVSSQTPHQNTDSAEEPGEETQLQLFRHASDVPICSGYNPASSEVGSKQRGQ